MHHEIPYPFVLEDVALPPDDPEGNDYRTVKSWRPGVRFEPCGPDDTYAVADGVGAMILREISRHRPGRYPTRVFFTRQWRSPDGKSFGKGRLHVMSAQHFSRLCNGYRYGYVVNDEAPNDANPS
jgi:hypothetical protein